MKTLWGAIVCAEPPVETDMRDFSCCDNLAFARLISFWAAVKRRMCDYACRLTTHYKVIVTAESTRRVRDWPRRSRLCVEKFSIDKGDFDGTFSDCLRREEGGKRLPARMLSALMREPPVLIDCSLLFSCFESARSRAFCSSF